jgi:1,4-alpha-glucan branching enzyme
MAAPTLSPEVIAQIAAGRHRDPFAVLGPHRVSVEGKSAFVIRAFLPAARAVSVVREGKAPTVTAMEKAHPDGFYEAVFPGRARAFRYRLHVEQTDETILIEDPYMFPAVLTDYDSHLLAEGTHHHAYDILGAHTRSVSGTAGVHFAVWAPNAGRVGVIGPFNGWDGRVHPMRWHPGSGIWEIFIPGMGAGTIYKFEVTNADFSGKADKSDPYGFCSELRPSNASVVVDLDAYNWGDDAWMHGRTARKPMEAPLAIYEVHLGSWRRAPGQNDRWLTYRELAPLLVAYVKRMGFTHIELLPVSEYPYDGSWGYQPVGYFAPTSRHGSPADFMFFVDYCHQHGIGIFLDWVPAHFPKDAHGLNFFDGTHLYEHADPRRGEHQDWGTLIFDYGRNEVRNFLLSNALFWLGKYHIDGLRVDAVASMLYLDYSRKPGEWLPNKYGGRENLEAIDFIKLFNELVHAEQPGVLTMAEESTAWPMVTRPIHLGGLGFDLKWNMGWMHDSLKYMSMDPLFRSNNHSLITFSMMYAFSENYILPLSHDEVVHLKKSLLDKMPGDEWKKFANLRAFFGYMAAHPGKKLLFMGSEFGQWREWSEARSLDWHLLEKERHLQFQTFVADLYHLYQREPALYELDFSWEGFAWIDPQDVAQSVISFIRRARDTSNFLVVVCNFTPVPRMSYRIGVPARGQYTELLNSDAEVYGGSNLGYSGRLPSEDVAWHSLPYSLVLALPPLSTLILKCSIPEPVVPDVEPARPL